MELGLLTLDPCVIAPFDTTRQDRRHRCAVIGDVAGRRILRAPLRFDRGLIHARPAWG